MNDLLLKTASFVCEKFRLCIDLSDRNCLKSIFPPLLANAHTVVQVGYKYCVCFDVS